MSMCMRARSIYQFIIESITELSLRAAGYRTDCRMPATKPESHSLRIHGLTCMSLVFLLSACGGGSQDTIRIGSGQTGNTGTISAGDFPIFYVKRITPDMTQAVSNNLDDVRRLRVFNTNADLYMRDRASPSAAEHNITARIHPANELWDVKDVDVSADASKVIFAMRGPLTDNQDDKDPPSWNIWEYTIATDTLRRVISSNVIAEEGQDVSPHYLPDGHILFSSTRQYQSKAVLLDENKGQFEAQDENRSESVFVLHVMNADGTNIQQITFNQSHDLDPTVLSDGRIVFSRWDHAPGRNGVHLYATNPDGTNTQLLYGSSSHTTFTDTSSTGTTTYPTVQFTKPREMPDGQILSVIRPFNGTEYGGDLYIIDTQRYVENNQPTLANAGMVGPAQSKSTPNNVRLINAPSPGGRFVSAVPLWDGTNRLLVSWSQCRLIDPVSKAPVLCTDSTLSNPAYIAAPPTYSVWMLNPSDGTQQPVVTPATGVMVSDLAIAQPRTAPSFRPYNLANNTSVDQTLKGEGVGILDIRSVYDFDGVANATGAGCTIDTNSDPANPTCFTNRPARFLRIEKAVSLPDRDVRNIDNNSFGATGFMREILGYIPVEPDGSVRFKVPANVAFQIAVVDTNGRHVNSFPSHNAWLTLRPGETVQCNGCHTRSNNIPAGQSGNSHGRSGLFASVYGGASSAGIAFNNANPGFISGNAGDTMAQARARWSCSFEQCASMTPGVNLAFADVWPAGTSDSRVNPTTSRSGDFSIRYAGTGGLTTKVPTSSACLTIWSNICRITINYLEHIQPIWERPLGFDANGDNVIDAKDNCLACHSRTDAANAPRVPAGQLDLTTDASDDNNLRVMSYQELLFGDNALELAGNVLQDHCLQFVTDPVTMVQTCTLFETVSPSLIARNAAASRFFTKFTSSGSHATAGAPWLTAGELKLISEWVDIGAQYYNDPFKAPVN